MSYLKFDLVRVFEKREKQLEEELKGLINPMAQAVVYGRLQEIRTQLEWIRLGTDVEATEADEEAASDELTVLRYLEERSDGQGQSFMTLDTIQDGTALNRDRLRRALAGLSARGYLRIDHSRPDRRPVYTITTEGRQEG